MLDVIAQSGNVRQQKRTSENSSSKANNITGCTRLRSPIYGAASVAIDRFTGLVVDKQIEVVNE
jgi:hypothetical protein